MTSIGGTVNSGYSLQKSPALKSAPVMDDAKKVFHEGAWIDLAKLDPSFATKAVDLSDEDYKAFEDRLRKSVPLPTPEPPPAYGSEPFVKMQMEAFASIDTGNGRIEISNAGYVKSDNGVGNLSYLDGLDSLSGPARAEKIAERLAERFGGKVQRAQTAVSQQVYDTMAHTAKPQESHSTENLLRSRDPEIEARLASFAAARAAKKAEEALKIGENI